jgi:hypothetical protein
LHNIQPLNLSNPECSVNNKNNIIIPTTCDTIWTCEIFVGFFVQY